MPQMVCHKDNVLVKFKGSRTFIYLFTLRISFNFASTRMWKYLHLVTFKPICWIYHLHSFGRSTYISRLVHTRTWSLRKSTHVGCRQYLKNLGQASLFQQRYFGGISTKVTMTYLNLVKTFFSHKENKSHEM